MIRARTINGNGNHAAFAVPSNNTAKRVLAKKRDHRRENRGSSPFFFTVFFGSMVLVMVLYFATGFYAVSKVHTQARPEWQAQAKVRRQTAALEQRVAAAKKTVALRDERNLLGSIRKEFHERYEYKHMNGDKLLKNGLHAFGSIEDTARRILEAADAKRPFVMAYSGYSITVGRGNFFNQSFPFVAGSILEEPLSKIFGIPLVVRNAAIGGIPSFPYGFCLDHFLGTDPDVVSWDYSMNEGGKDASVLEAFVRQATAQLPKRPMVIMVDTNAVRMKTLDDYTQRGWLKDAIAIGKHDALGKHEKIFGEMPHFTPESELPPGLRDWKEFGAPANCPGRGSWHPKRQEHAMMGWIIAMHFVEAMEKAIELFDKEGVAASSSRKLSYEMPKFGKPLSRKLPTNDPEVTELLFGHATPGEENYVMKHLSCRTSFLPATDHAKTLSSVVVSGLAEGDLDIMVDRTDEHYKEGWVLDVSKTERDTKRKVEKCGGLGYIDMKIAMYGIPESGKLRLWLPFEGPSHDHHGHDGADANAGHWFDDFVLCEANDKRPEEACKLDRDLELVVGGVTVASENIHPLKGAAEYLKRPTCANVGVPKDAVVTKLGDLRTPDGGSLTSEDKARFGAYGKNDETLGMVVDVTAKSTVTRKDGACCLSHIVWEQH